ncbi:hypothetical protein K466DRAFT_582813 [Polyporus arcularius HHB13444]|uniref:DUF6533 domain-containing protein n=1 Tax=Polyporus arcularius HHB13444 TaxID=1314778 RepID=A0A5C3PNU6_9APHY|nr:hypothetical protein K466DRAFT_582813 [Polyporus arcularius HHB13444]
MFPTVGDAALFDALYTGEYFNLAAAVVFIYDVLITLDREVACFWTSEQSGASLLFFSNKWISVTLYVMMTLVGSASFPSDQVIEAMTVLQLVPAAIFSALRAYALSRSKLLGLLILTLSLGPVGANLVVYGYQLSGFNLPPFGCVGKDNATKAITLSICTVIIGSRVPVVIADTLLIYITWAKLSSKSVLEDFRLSKRLSLSDVLFRNGSVLSLLNILHLALAVFAVAKSDSFGVYVTTFTTPYASECGFLLAIRSISAILISRFLLELQEANQTVIRLDSDDPLHSSRDPFETPSFISSLGAVIDPGLPAQSDDDLEWDVDSFSDEVPFVPGQQLVSG